MAGLTWNTYNSGITPYEPPTTNGALWFIHNGNTGYATSADDGATWTARTFVAGRHIGVLRAVGSRVFSLGQDDVYGPYALYYTDNGTSWTELVPTPDYTNGILSVVSDGTNLYVKLSDVDYDETWYRVNPTTFTWTAITPPGSAALVGGSGVIFSTSYDGTLHRSTDGGDTWTEVVASYALSNSTITPMFVQDGVWLASDSTNDSPVFLRSTDNGAAWVAVVPTGAFTPTSNAFNNFRAAGLDGTIVVSTIDNDPGIWYSQDGGDSWTKDDNIGLDGSSTSYVTGTATLLMVVSDEDAVGNVYTTESAAVTTTQNVEDAPATVSDEFVHGRAVFVVETATASDAISHFSFTTVVETASASDAVRESSQQFVEEVIQASDAVSSTSLQVVVETATADDTAVGSSAQIVVESAMASDAVQSTSVSATSIVETALASDAIAQGLTDDIEETATASDSVRTSTTQFVVETATASDELAGGTLGLSTLVEEVGVVSDAIVSAGGVTLDAVDEVAVASDTYFHKDPTAIAWVMNTETGAPYWYSNWQFAHMTQAGNRVFAVGPEGLVELGADTDNGEEIDAGVTYGFMDMGAEQKKRVDGFWFGYAADGRLSVSVETYGQGYPIYAYEMERRAADSPRNNRVIPGKGLNARYWRIGIDNIGGCDFAVDSIAADLAVSARRI